MNYITIEDGRNTMQITEAAYAEHFARFRKYWSLDEDFDGCPRAERRTFEAILIEELQIEAVVLGDREVGA